MLRKLPDNAHVNSYRATDGILAGGGTDWPKNRKALQWVFQTAQNITGTVLPVASVISVR